MPWRILHLDTERTWRGGQQQAFLLARALAGRGHNSAMACPGGSPLANRCAQAGLRVIPLSFKGEWDLQAVLHLRQILASRTVHILHAHSAHAAGLAAWSMNPTIRGFVISRRVDFPIRKNIFSRWKYQKADKILAISHGVKAVLKDDGIPEDKITVVPSGIDLTAYQDIGRHSPLSEWGFSAETPLVGIVAALAPHKDHRNFLEAASLIKQKQPRARFLIVGEGECEQDLKSYAHALGLDNEALFTGFRKDALEILAQLSVAVLSSATEGMGTVLLEAMALGRPLVATATGGIPEVIEDGKNGFLVPPKDPSALARAVLRLLENKELAAAFGRAGKKKVEEFSIENTVLQTEAVYREILEKNKVLVVP